MRSIIIATLIVLLPAAIFGTPTLGVYFSDADPATVPGQMHYVPPPSTYFYGYVYAHKWGCGTTAAEFKIDIDPRIIYAGFGVPDDREWLNLGDPATGVAFAWWPPIFDYPDDYRWLCWIKLIITQECYTGDMVDVPILIVAHPGSGEIRGTCWDEGANTLFNYLGQKSVLCPLAIDIEDQSWGAIKSQFK